MRSFLIVGGVALGLALCVLLGALAAAALLLALSILLAVLSPFAAIAVTVFGARKCAAEWPGFIRSLREDTAHG
ncbi:MAG: hypothetical protein Q8L84_10010 [Hyphomonas sp.]|nr:hypothetical protein [Hyphomonas sp.]